MRGLRGGGPGSPNEKEGRLGDDSAWVVDMEGLTQSYVDV